MVMTFDLNLGSVGLLPPTENALKTLLASVHGNPGWRYIEDGVADVWVVDMDLPNGAEPAALNFPPLADGRRPLIVPYGGDLGDDAGLVLDKPLRSEDLQRVLDQAARIIGPKSRQASQEPVRKHGGTQSLASVLFACGALEISTDGGVELWVDMSAMRYVGDGEAFVAALAAGDGLGVTPVESLPAGATGALEPLLWRAVHAVNTPPLPIWLRPDYQLRLHEWPEFDVLPLTPGEVRMVALLLQRSACMMELGPLTGTRPRDVRRFLSGAAVLQLLTEAHEAEYQPTPSGGVFSHHAGAHRAVA